jgi:predicted kinase
MPKTRERMGSLQHLIIITGSPATGKSTLAPRVASRYGSTLLTKDEIKEELFDILGTGDASWSRRLSNASFATMFALAGDALGGGGSVVLEGNMRAGEHEAAMHALLARSSSIRCVQVLCKVAEDLRRERIDRRARRPIRHAGHLDAAIRFASATAAFLEIPSIRLEFDGSKSSKAAEQLFAALDVSLQQPA